MPLPYLPHDSQKPLRICVAGSTDRTDDVESILREALLRIKQEYGEKISFVFFGVSPQCATELEATSIPFCNSYDDYRRIMNELEADIGLAPMPDTAFHACKHYNKFVEYAAANIVGIFSAVKPYDRLERQFGWQLMCSNTADCWHDAIVYLIEHPKELDRLKKELAGLTEKQLSLREIARSLLNHLDALPVQVQPQRLSLISFGLLRSKTLAIQFSKGLKRYGIIGSLVVLQKKLGFKKA